MGIESDLPGDVAPLAAQLREKLADHRAASLAIEHISRDAADERLAAVFLLELADKAAARLVRLLLDHKACRDLIFCLGASEIVGAGLLADVDAGLDLFEAVENSTSGVAFDESARLMLAEAADWVEAERCMREYKRRQFLRIAIADLTGRSDVRSTMTAMSRLADECVRGALAAAARLTGADLERVKFCVVAMGKLGAGELNLSSDIDLMYLFESPDVESGQPVATRLAERLTELLSTIFRTDLRLRPGGRNSPLVASLDSSINFYANQGQTWERAALLRARPVAGDLELGGRFLAELNRFVYRRFLDFDTLRDLRAMKRQIEAELRPSGMVDRNIKLGYGGIRELEFIVQSLILIYGGRDARLRTVRTIDALDRLADFGYMPAERARELSDAYLFLRNVEHKLQVVAGRQTHNLPPPGEAFAALATRMGMGKSPEAATRLRQELDGRRRLVAQQFREMLLGGDSDETTPASELARAAWHSALDPEESAPILRALGFGQPAEGAADLKLLVQGPSRSPASTRRRELLDTLVPTLLDEISRLPDPGLALHNLTDFIASVGARTSFLTLLEQHPTTRRVMLRLFASSEYLSTLFIRHPEMLDTLVRSDLARVRREQPDLAEELAGLISVCPDFESSLDALRSFRHQEFLRIAIADLAGSLGLEEVQRELTALAETVLRQALVIARDSVAEQREVPRSLQLAVLALGRLGAREMSYNSDLDLFVVYEDPGEKSGSSREIAAKIAQRLIAVLESRTREGYAYKLDLRLRPSGNAGPLVASFEGFCEYHRAQAAVWERQAMLRARAAAGDGPLVAKVEAARREIVFGRSLTESEVREIRAMRARMERELGAERDRRLNLKQGMGGLVDVEFVTQMMAMRHAALFRDLAARDTASLIGVLSEHALIPSEEAANLLDDYRFLARLENRLRIETDFPAWALPTAPEELKPLARRMGFADPDGEQVMLEQVVACRQRIRATFDRCFDRELGIR
jgi:glutamate-ammonia-ligase adenylyltransferase